MSSKFSFIEYIQQFGIDIDDFMDMYSEFAELDSDTRIEIIQEYSDKINGEQKKERMD